MKEFSSIGELVVNWIFWFAIGTAVSFILLSLWDNYNGRDD